MFIVSITSLRCYFFFVTLVLISLNFRQQKLNIQKLLLQERYDSTLHYQCIIRGKRKIPNKNKIFVENVKINHYILKIIGKFQPWWSFYPIMLLKYTSLIHCNIVFVIYLLLKTGKPNIRYKYNLSIIIYLYTIYIIN